MRTGDKPRTGSATMAAVTRALHEQNRKSWNHATVAHNSHKGNQAAFLRSGGSTLFPEELDPHEGVQPERAVFTPHLHSRRTRQGHRDIHRLLLRHRRLRSWKPSWHYTAFISRPLVLPLRIREVASSIARRTSWKGWPRTTRII